MRSDERFFKVQIEGKFYPFRIDTGQKEYAEIRYPEVGGPVGAARSFRQDEWMAALAKRLKQEGYSGITDYYAAVYRVTCDKSLREIVAVFQQEGEEIDLLEYISIENEMIFKSLYKVCSLGRFLR